MTGRPLLHQIPEPGRADRIRPVAAVQLRHLAASYLEAGRDELGQTMGYDPTATLSPLEAAAIEARDRILSWFTGESPQDFGATARLLGDAYALIDGFLASSNEARSYVARDEDYAAGPLADAHRDLLEGIGRVDDPIALAGRLAERTGPGDVARVLAGGRILAGSLAGDSVDPFTLEDALEMARDRATMWPPTASAVELDLWRSAAGRLQARIAAAFLAGGGGSADGQD